MKTTVSPLISLLTGSILLVLCSANFAGAHVAPPWIGGVVHAKLRRSAGQEQLEVFLATHATEVLRDYDQIGWIQLGVPKGQSVESFSEQLKQHPGLFAAVEPVYKLTFHGSELTDPPNDPEWPSQWSMQSVFAPTAWYFSTTSTNSVIALIDTGVRLTHVELRDNIWRNPGESGIDDSGNNRSTNGLDDDNNGYVDDVHGIDPVNNDTDPTDDVGHGTRLCGVIAATGGNGIGVAGVNWSARVMPLKIGFPSGSSTVAQVDWILECFNYMITMKNRGVNIRVANNSYGSSAFTSLALSDAFQSAGENGILTVCSVGNSSSNLDLAPVYPASYDFESNIAVGSNSRDFTPFPGTSFGQATVDLMAPGEVKTTDISSDTATGTRIGTSYAAALVTGSLALLAELAPSTSAAELKALMMSNLTQSAALAPVCRSGGSLNLGRAALEAINWRGDLAIQRNPLDEIEITWSECPPGVALYSSSRVDGTEPFTPVDSTGNENTIVIPQPIENQRYFLFLGP